MKRHLPSLIVFVSCAFLAVTIAITVSLAVRKSDHRRQEAVAQATAVGLWTRYDADIAGCNRGDTVRTLLHDFLSAAEKARRSPPLEPGDLEAADAYAELNSRIWPLTPCNELIPPPGVSRPKGTKQ